MRNNFDRFYCDQDPIDSADWLLDFAHDLVFLSRTALTQSEPSDLRDVAGAAARALDLTEALLVKVAEGYEGLARPAKRGCWGGPSQACGEG